MEPDEIKLIQKVSFNLLKQIEYRSTLEKILEGSNILGPGDVDSLQVSTKSNHQKVDTLISHLYKKTGAFVLFYKALVKDDQTGAAKTIMDEADQNYPELAYKLREADGAVTQQSDVRDSKRKAVEVVRDAKIKKLEEEEDIPKSDPYNLPPTGKGLVLPINLIEFDKKQMNRISGRHDNTNIRKLFPELGWKIYPDDFEDKKYYKKKEIKKMIQDFKTECVKTKAKSCVIFIGSHGKDGRIGTSDMKKILVNYIISEFYHANFKFMVGKPKIFIVQACRAFKDGEDGEDVFNEFESDEEDGDKVQDEEDSTNVPNADTIIIKSQLPGMPAYRHPEIGSYLMHCITKVFDKYAHDKSVFEMMKMVREKVNKLKPEQMPEIKLQGEQDFYLFP